MKCKIFTYGTLRKNESNHSILSFQGANYIGTSTTKDKYIKDYIKDSYDNIMFPYLLELNEENFKDVDITSVNNIKGEVYEVNKKALKALDRFEDGYYRKLIYVNLSGKFEECWCYFLNKKMWENFKI